MPDTLRIPTKWIVQIAEDLKVEPNKHRWSFVSDGGNVLAVERIIKVDDRDHHLVDSLDFEYNPGD